MMGEGGGWLRSRCSGWKLEISRKSKCVGAKERALTVLDFYRAEIQCQDLTESRQRIFHLYTATEGIILVRFAVVCWPYSRIRLGVKTMTES